MDTNDWVTGDITLRVNGAPLNLKLTVPAKPAPARVMLPLFMQLANSFTDIGVQLVEKEGQTISCRKGCGACCRQPVPLAEIEIYHIAAVVQNLPEPRRTEVKAKFEAGVAHFHSMSWFEKLEACEDEAEVKKLVLEYFFEGVPCPFLEDESCSIHQDRPVACREYMVTSPPENCSNPIEETLSQVPLPINASMGVRKVGRMNDLANKDFLPMIRALEWAGKYPEHLQQKTGEEWLSEFFS